MLVKLFILGALLQASLASHHEEGEGGEVCTDIIVTGDDAEASCTCTCVCDIDCPLETTTPEPTTEPPTLGCTAGWAGKNVVTGFDGGSFTMLTNNKYLTSTYFPAPGDQCNFQVRIDTEDDPAVEGDVQVGWMGVAFGVHDKNPTKFERNFRVSLTQGVVELRGRGTNPVPVDTGCYGTITSLHPWTFCLSGAPGDWTIELAVPNLGCSVTVTYQEAGQGGNVSGNDRAEIQVSDFYNGQLEGSCGNKDTISANDPVCAGVSPGSATDCIDGEHQYNG